jgi:Uncharacterised nucleotidyltransferase
MRQLAVAPDFQLLVRLLRVPQQLRDLPAPQFSRAIDAADQARLLGWLLAQAEARQVRMDCPEWLRDRVATARARVGEYERAVRWEIDRLNRAFVGIGFPWVLLKGAAYIAAGLPPGRGRRVADIDVLVPHQHLAEAEAALQAHGWQVGELDPYDTRYYREWMHELPPMVHQDRRSIVDLHHAILPRTSRLAPSSARLIERSLSIDGSIRILCPAHMVLHAAAHLFHDGEIAGAVRDVVDLDGLLRRFGQTPDFWNDFIREARVLELTRPAYYAVRYARRLLATPVPPDVVDALNAAAPPSTVRWLMDVLVETTLVGKSRKLSSVAGLALYVRSHWLRMPPLLLARHLLRKSSRRS